VSAIAATGFHGWNSDDDVDCLVERCDILAAAKYFVA